MPRLFVGFELPAPIRGRLASMKGAFAGARWIDPEDYHITLSFLGDISNSLASDVHDALSDLDAPTAPVRLNGLDAFGGDRPHSVFARVDAHPALMRLQSDIERTVRNAGAEVDKRRFQPHVTLARLRGTTPESVAYFLSAYGYFPPMEFTPSRFVLYSSRASVGGGPYHVEASYPLRIDANASIKQAYPFQIRMKA
jgi:RNA 2',3'-cyclic 3'-phosphodiesterase